MTFGKAIGNNRELLVLYIKECIHGLIEVGDSIINQKLDELEAVEFDPEYDTMNFDYTVNLEGVIRMFVGRQKRGLSKR